MARGSGGAGRQRPQRRTKTSEGNRPACAQGSGPHVTRTHAELSRHRSTRTTSRQPWSGNLRREHENHALCRHSGFSLGIGSAHAGDGNSATTLFTSIQNQQAAPAKSIAAQTPTITGQNGGAAVPRPDARSQGQGTWLFPHDSPCMRAGLVKIKITNCADSGSAQVRGIRDGLLSRTHRERCQSLPNPRGGSMA
jgi:hypothetical protein